MLLALDLWPANRPLVAAAGILRRGLPRSTATATRARCVVRSEVPMSPAAEFMGGRETTVGVGTSALQLAGRRRTDVAVTGVARDGLRGATSGLVP
jgi:hypothetical protein